jgi:hypothetical protein
VAEQGLERGRERDLTEAGLNEPLTLTAKNRLTATDAKLVEDAFERRFSGLPSSVAAVPSKDDSSVPLQVIATTESTDAGQAKGVDKSILAVAAPRRYRNREHLRYVAQPACLVCGRKPSDPHRLGFTQPRALGRKVSDEFAVPLCRGHHRAVHRSRDERATALTRSRLPAGSGRRRADWASGGPNDRHYLGRGAPRPLI